MNKRSGKRAVRALLVVPGDESLTRAVEVDPDDARQLARHIGCDLVELWPRSHSLRKVDTPSGRSYRYDIWVDEEGAINGAEANMCATFAAHPLGQAMGLVVAGNALLVSTDKAQPDLGVDDWRQICQGVYYDDDMVDHNVKQNSHRDA
jgi:hypothetical protein